MSDSLGDRLKIYENKEAGRRLMPLLPALCRIDGKCFSNFTRGMKRPFDKRMSDLMIETAQFLVKETNACIGYTQSDEISLSWFTPDYQTQIFFDGRIQKMTSVLSSMTTAFFNDQYKKYFSEQPRTFALFDCRIWNVPNIEEGANTFLWRELDAYKNSISMAARHYYSHNELMNKNGNEMQDMLWKKGINYNDYPAFFKRGTFVQRRTIKRRLTPEELVNLPQLHEARKNPEVEFERTEYKIIDMPPFNQVINRTGVVYFGEDPLTGG